MSSRGLRAIGLMVLPILAVPVLASCTPTPAQPPADASQTGATRIWLGRCLTPGLGFPGALFPVMRFAIKYHVVRGQVVVGAMNVGWKYAVAPDLHDPEMFPDVSMRPGARAWLDAGKPEPDSTVNPIVNVDGDAGALTFGSDPATYTGPGAHATTRVRLEDAASDKQTGYPAGQATFFVEGPSDFAHPGGPPQILPVCTATVELPVSGCGTTGGGEFDPGSPVVENPVFRGAHGEMICNYYEGSPTTPAPASG